ncbi:MAG TPA: plastocyanin/azurin family copper-binding protein [Ktedonobacteraceae bacterium]
MSKKLFAILGLCSVVLTVILVACGATSTGTSSAPNQVHMNATNFVQPSITIKKGESITLIDDAQDSHIIANGTWENGTARPENEHGAPQVENLQISGSGQGTIGPFTTAGTFHFYCTIHSGMNLTVVVQ